MSAKPLSIIFTGVLNYKAALSLPATTTHTLFTVANGPVLVTGLAGLVTTVLGATATTLALGTGTGSLTTSIATAATVTSSAVGTWYLPQESSGASAAPLILGPGPAFLGNNFQGLFGADTPFLLNADTITWTTSATDTGAMDWYLWYVPLLPGVTVS